jgi:hypothetical protein
MEPVGGAHEQVSELNSDEYQFRFSSFSVPGALMGGDPVRYLGGGFFRACIETYRKLHSKWQGQ